MVIYSSIDDNNKSRHNYSIKEFYQLINGIIINLSEIGAVTEEKFVKYGTLLNKSHNNIQSILGNTKETINIISSQNLSDNIKNLEKIIDLLYHSISIAEKKLATSRDSIFSINDNIEAINERMENFNGFVKRLRMLGLSTKIESARIGQTSNGFQNLAVNVETQSNKIETKIKLIFSKSNELLRLIEDVSQKTIQLQDKSNGMDLNSCERIKQKVSLFSQKIVEAKNNSKNISNYSNEISKILSSLISSFQYQDISKQQIGHICSALKAVENEYQFKSKNEDLEKWFSTVYNVCSIQQAQIQNTKTDFLNATMEMIERLREIENLMNSFQRMNIELLDVKNNKNKSFIAQIEEEIRNVTLIINNNAKSVNEIVNLVNNVNETVNILSSFVKEVEDIDEDIELISVNAQIKAARLGNEGAALGVLAQNIQQLSVSTKLETAEMTNSFKVMNEQSGILNDLLISGSEKLKELSSNKVKEELNNIFLKLCEIQNKIMSNLDSNDSLINVAHSHFDQTEDINELHIKAGKTFEDVIYALGKVINGLPVKKNLRLQSNEDINKLKENYTMKSERDIHDSIYDKSNNPEINHNTGSDDDFGDNVDLF
ncbi:MAG: methyl-accepting chemotaxis protein [Ignavibacteria bacterium]|jgi:methyl-accepting chemotaxis protein